MKPWRSKPWRQAGRGLPCVFCGRNAETVCGRHVRLKGFCGFGQKPPDFLLVDLCDHCDRDFGELNRDDDAVDVLRAIARTLERRAEQGYLGESE